VATIPVLLDVRPAYLGDGPADSLLLLPTGTGTLFDEVRASVAAVTPQPPLVLPLFAADAGYARGLRGGAGAPPELLSPAVFRDPLARFEPSDQLLLVAPGCYPADGLDLRRLVGARVDDARMMRHLLAFETTSLRTKEFVQPGSDGRVRRIQRYFEPVTWPFPAGVIASLVPVACVLTGPDAPWASLGELRAMLAARGVPSQDVPFHDQFFHLEDEGGALALAEHRVLALTGAREPRREAFGSPVVTGRGARVHPTARLVGPVVLGDDVTVDADALVVGPALLGAGVRLETGAVVAQCLVTAGTTVAGGVPLRARVVGPAPSDATARRAQRRHTRLAAPTAEAPPPPTAYARCRDVLEPLAALVLLVLLSPLLAAAALLVALTSRGPVFYGDPREGRDGRPFRCWKFRSMLANADAMQRALAAQQQMDGPQFKMERDPRVTPVGAWLRRLNVDELPQLWNVVRGEMSFVGPRPSPFRENQICVPWRHGRLSVRPGITGLWQVCRRDRETGDFHQWIHYDLLYVRHASFAVDVRILVATLVMMATRRPVPLEAIIRDADHADHAADPDADDAPPAEPAGEDPLVLPRRAAVLRRRRAARR
jgi:lipopolysaccharide/colanic/teichoic acid biosynthesis glycosyltransferase